MQIANDEEQYGLVSKVFHWLTAFLIIGLLPVGLIMGGMENSPVKFQIYAMHKSFGLLVLFIGIARLAWRFISPPPERPEAHKPWEQAAASAAHAWLYVCIIGMPLSGWLMSSASDFPVPFFGIMMPHLIEESEDLGGLFYQVHEILAYTLLFVLSLHIAGALKHHVLDKDDTLKKMTYRNAGILIPVVVVILVGLSYALSGGVILKGLLAGREVKDAAAEAQVLSQAPSSSSAGMGTRAELGADEWLIVPEESSLKFTASLYGGEFTGEFTDFNGMIRFNPERLNQAKVLIFINMQSVETGDQDRDINIKSAEWFNTGSFPQAKFETVAFAHAEGNNYIAIGNLTIRDVTMPVSLPFEVEIKDNKAKAAGNVTVNRLNFSLGTGQWESGDTVGHDVRVQVSLTAIQ